MDDIYKFAFLFLIVYLIATTLQTVFAGYQYDNAKKKSDKAYKDKHSIDFLGGTASAIIPTKIKDTDPLLEKYVTRYNKLALRWWISFLIGIPLFIYLLEKVNNT
ncbi:hypothetical protein ACE1ET_20360 [Saccharicrinis sp. FJH62]|uniref:hypothetical protein n=1 Tax=Saccharicrinis sp. FJH62 TaxID=3344657 RepID=UPI0035D52994